MKISKIIFIVFVILAEIAYITAMVYYNLKFNNQNEKISVLLLILIISGLLGTMFFLPTYLNSKMAYTLPTAFINYLIMIFECVTMLFGITLFGDSMGSYAVIYLPVIFIFFGLSMLTYSKKIYSSLIQLVVLIGYLFLNIIFLRLFSHSTLSSFEIIYTSLFKNGFIFTWSLTVGGLLVFGRFWYLSLNNDKNIKELEGVQNLKTLYIPFALYFVFIFVPGVWYLSHGFVNFFELKSSLFVVFIDIVYFVYLVYSKSRDLSYQFGEFLTGKYEKAASKDKTL